MSAETLRKAAALMRERAEAATPGPWSNGDNEVSADADLIYDDPRWPGQPVLPQNGPMEVAECYRDETRGERQANAEHIASWHPAVALAVADWLDGEAGAVEFDGGRPDLLSVQSLAVARAYLGEPSC